MNFRFFFLMLFLAFSSVFSQEMPRIEEITIDSKQLNQQRHMLIYTPSYYDDNSLTHYEVVYVFDAQSREFFDLVHSLLNFTAPSSNFIVVGIMSTYIESLDYSRNNDMLPAPLHEDPRTFYNGYSGNADNFLGYVEKEVIPYMDSHYRTKNSRIAIGHSLSASLILYSMFKSPNLFDAYFAISPNFAFDKERMVNEFKQFDYQKLAHKNFVYLSNADEGINYWKEWLPARNKVYEFLNNSVPSDKLTSVIKEFPEESHWPTFAPSLMYGFKSYFKIRDEFLPNLSSKSYEVTINLKVLDKDDDVYITGNQQALGNWNPSEVKMQRISDFQRSIKLNLKSPAEFKFTRGNWETEGGVKLNGGSGNIYINPEKASSFAFEISYWVDKE